MKPFPGANETVEAELQMPQRRSATMHPSKCNLKMRAQEFGIPARLEQEKVPSL